MEYFGVRPVFYTLFISFVCKGLRQVRFDEYKNKEESDSILSDSSVVSSVN